MKTIIIVIAILISVDSLTAQVYSMWRSSDRIVKIKTDSSVIEYSKLDQLEPTSIVVQGPGVLTVLTRGVMPKDESSALPFTLKYTRGNKHLNYIEIPDKIKSNKSFIKGDESLAISTAHKVNIQVPEGEHELSFLSENVEVNALIRLAYTKTENAKWREVYPSGLEQIHLRDMTNYKSVYYSQITSNDVFRFKTTKDTKRIRVFFRTNFDVKMLEDCLSRLQIRIDGKPMNYKILSRKSTQLENLSHPHFTPGVLEKIYLEFPMAPDQDIEIALRDKSAHSALIRVFESKSDNNQNCTDENIAYTN